MRGRRARAHASQENLVKDSSSDISPRDSTATTLVNRRRQRRNLISSESQQFENGAFAEDERRLPPPIERIHDIDDAEEENNIQDADRLVSHVSKQHNRIVNELQAKKKKSRRKTPMLDADNDQDDLTKQIREQQDIVSRRVDNTDSEQILPVESFTESIGRTHDQSIEKILDRAKESRVEFGHRDEGKFVLLAEHQIFNRSMDDLLMWCYETR
jgi:hypothetical protein